MEKKPVKLIANNKKAYHDYFIEEKYEAGLALEVIESVNVHEDRGKVSQDGKVLHQGVFHHHREW